MSNVPLTPDGIGYDWREALVEPDISHIEIEDDAPLVNIYSEKQQRLLTEPLYTSWSAPADADGNVRAFFAAANVGVFASIRKPPLVPDMLFALDVEVHPDAPHEKRHNTYFVWEMGKAPDVVVEIVSNRKGGELKARKAGYEQMRATYYVVWDPEHLLGERELSSWSISDGPYVPMVRPDFPHLGGLSLRPWDGVYEGLETRWLRWYADGELVPTGAERAEAERSRAEAERSRAEAERSRADAARTRIEHLEALLAAHGIDANGGE